MTNAFSEINILTYTDEDFEKRVELYKQRGYTFESENKGIVHMHRRDDRLDEYINIYRPAKKE